MEVLIRLRNILNTYTDEELEKMDLWIDATNRIESIYIDENNITLLTDSAEVKINDNVEKESH